ncbi:YfhO family protein [Neobacillus fumarioli]|uniref:YfhO family protein n=1 Tax=Neobacillus fumarioli TaxID=105229 RepID=UPI000829AB97|nr:YfhO family protein [Neobacillus fumarioli]
MVLKRIVKIAFPVTFFLCVSLGIHLYFFIANTLFTARGGDSIDQYLIFHQFLHNAYRHGNVEWSWEYGLGGDIFGQFIYYYATSLFFWLSLLIKGSSVTAIIQAKFFLSILKCFLCMLFMYLLLMFNKRSMFSSIAGAFIYTGSVFFAKYSLRSDFMVDAMVWLPFVILAFDWYIDRKKQLPFILSVFLICFSNFYFAFITSVYLFAYALCKFFLIHQKFKLKTFIIYYIKIAANYVAGLLLSSVSFLPAVYHFLHADRFSKKFDIPILFDLNYYKHLYYQLFFSVSDLTFPVICLGLFFIGFWINNCEVKIRLTFTIVVFVFYLLPITSSFFNGLSAIQFRWFYLVVFTMALYIPFVLDHLIQIGKKLTFIVLVEVCLIFMTLTLRSRLLHSHVDQVDEINFILFIIGAVLLTLKTKVPKWLFQTCMLGLVAGNILFNNFIFFTHELGPYQTQKAINDLLFGPKGFDNQSEREVINYIKKHDTSFYRVMWKDVKQYNLPMVYDYNGFSAYQSLIPYNVSKFFKENYNTLQFDSPSLFKNLDQRLYLETALSTKYYFVANHDPFQPYGYKKLKTFKDYTIYENQNWLPLAFMAYQGISRAEFQHLNFSDRDQLLLTGAVTPSSPGEYGLKLLPESKLSGMVLHNGWKEVSMHGISRKGNLFLVGNNGYLEIPFQQPKQPGEILTEMTIQNTAGKQFVLNINGKNLLKREENSTYSYPQSTFVFNLGYQKTQNPIRISLTPGEYSISDLKVTFTSYQNFQASVKALQSRELQNLKVTDHSVSGQISSTHRGVLVTSIPYNIGWHAEIDGKKADTFEVNSTFVGLKVPKGTHQIKLVYSSPYLKEGLGITISTLFMIIIIALYKSRRKGLSGK